MCSFEGELPLPGENHWIRGMRWIFCYDKESWIKNQSRKISGWLEVGKEGAFENGIMLWRGLRGSQLERGQVLTIKLERNNVCYTFFNYSNEWKIVQMSDIKNNVKEIQMTWRSVFDIKWKESGGQLKCVCGRGGECVYMHRKKHSLIWYLDHWMTGNFSFLLSALLYLPNSYNVHLV